MQINLLTSNEIQIHRANLMHLVTCNSGTGGSEGRDKKRSHNDRFI